jgi:hypothetical protein
MLTMSDKVQVVEAAAEAYVQWVNPPHCIRAVTESDRQLVKAVLAAADRKSVELR